MSASEQASFEDIVGRLDEIVDLVRDKGTSLEHSLDLLDEAIKLGIGAVDLVDSPQAESGESSGTGPVLGRGGAKEERA